MMSGIAWRKLAWWNVVVLLGVFLLAFALHETYGGNRYDFGYPWLVDWCVFGLLCGLALTHLMLSAIMFTSSDIWIPSESAMFRFIGAKTVFWSLVAVEYPFSGKGVMVDYAVLWVQMVSTTAHLDIRLFGRYILGWEDDDIQRQAEQIEEKNGNGKAVQA
jgi:hypothetical protein